MLMSRISLPSSLMHPAVTSKNLGIRLTIVLLPEPVLPIMAVVSPGFAEKLIPDRAGASAPSYLKETLSNLKSY